MERRKFIKTSVIASLATGISSPALHALTPYKKHLTILHTNDVHSHIDPFPADHPKYPNLGGVVKRASLIEQIRLENKNVLLLDAGDTFQGTPYFNYFGGELEFKLMNMMGYDATTIGNHEFDNGVSGLASQVPHAKFDIINSNYDFKNTAMEGLSKPYRIFNKNGIKVGVFGLGVELAGLVDKKMYKETVYLDPVEISIDMVRILKQELQCDLIICLSHLGYAYANNPEKISDVNLAKKTKDIDLIIGGHTHTFLDKPTTIKNIEEKTVIINQVGCFGVNLGRIDILFEAQKKGFTTSRTIIV